MGQPHTDAGTNLRPTLRPPAMPLAGGFLSTDRRNRPLAPLAETINGCQVYGNGEKRFYVHAGPEIKRCIMLKAIEVVGMEKSPYLVLCALRPEQGTIRIEYIQNIYPGCLDPSHPERHEPDMISLREPPLPEWKGFGFFPILLEHTMRIAAEKGIHMITIDPDNSDLREYYSKFGFRQDPEKETRMQLTF